jgi:hypothetical protein
MFVLTHPHTVINQRRLLTVRAQKHNVLSFFLLFEHWLGGARLSYPGAVPDGEILGSVPLVYIVA